MHHAPCFVLQEGAAAADTVIQLWYSTALTAEQRTGTMQALTRALGLEAGGRGGGRSGASGTVRGKLLRPGMPPSSSSAPQCGAAQAALAIHTLAETLDACKACEACAAFMTRRWRVTRVCSAGGEPAAVKIEELLQGRAAGPVEFDLSGPPLTGSPSAGAADAPSAADSSVAGGSLAAAHAQRMPRLTADVPPEVWGTLVSLAWDWLAGRDDVSGWWI